MGVICVTLLTMIEQSKARRYIQKMLHIPIGEEETYTEMKTTAAQLKKSMWRYVSDLHKKHQREESSGW